MKRVALAAVLGLAACSQQPADAPPAATPTPATTASASPAVAAVGDDHAVPKPGDLKTFRDWTVACDNVARCAMASLGTDADFPAVTLQVARAAGPDGLVEVALAMPQGDNGAPATLRIDGRAFAVSGDGLSGASAEAIARALANATTIEALDKKGKRLGTISAAGASAGLRYIDAQQGRAGTVTALVARGDKPAATVLAARAAPRVRAVAFAGTPAALSPGLLAGMRRTAECDPSFSGPEPRAHGLADGATLVLLPCSAGAYNEIDALFIVRDGKATPARVDAPAGFEETGADSQTPVHSVINGDVDGGVLRSYAKGRGLGDCGVMQSFVWDGTQLRLTEQRSMGECRGNPDYLPVWQARVVRE
ncbi:DUF1176 domain-containing protein [Sphingomonas endophytica]|uniref:DUF1176 domain-containing protein n=1 Tax=Sphingomonas endophytica TaxID=869719 RepID=UPI00161A5A36|nr:DUF1176 domain-containing protein [Sphingomonas endophytica]